MNVLVRRRTNKAARLATVVLLLIAFVSNSMMYAYAAGGETFSFAIGETTFTVTPGSDPFVTSTTEGAVEIATANGAVIWANLGGAGSGSLTESMISGLENVPYTLSGNTLTFTDSGYAVTVRDNSASGTPVADGSTTTYDFRDGSVVSTLYDGQSNSISDGNSVYSTDRLMELTGNSGIYYNGSQHGIVIQRNDSVSVRVAGNATITLSLCGYAATDGLFTVSNADGGNISPETVTARAAADGDTTAVSYEGNATTLTFTYSGGSGYIHWISVTNDAEETEINMQDEMPGISGVGLIETVTGQRLTLSQSGGSLATNYPLSDTVGYYGFPSTSGVYTLEADVTVTACGNSSAYGVFLGAFNAADGQIAVAGIRNTTQLRPIYTRDDGTLGASSSIDATIAEGQTVHIEAQKTGDNIVITLTPEGGQEYTADLPCLETCSLGFAVANADATVTNMVYTAEDGTVLYDQNDCYEPIGQAPIVTAVEAVAEGTREAIHISWQISTPASGDGYYLVEASHDGSGWTEIARTTETSCTYPISEGGDYQFRVSGHLGTNETSTSPAMSEVIYVVRALTTPVLTLTAGANDIVVSWDAVPEATSYEIYRYSDDTDVQLIHTAGADETTYADTSVTAEVPYYYYMVARSADNWSNPSETVWALPSAGHTGAYLPAEDGAQFTLTAGTEATVSSPALTIAGTVDRAGVVRAYLGDTQLGDQTVRAGGAFSYDLTLAEGSNTVTLIHTDADNNWSRAVYCYYYLPMDSGSIDMIVDAAYTGTDGTPDATGIPTYRTVQAAVDAVPADNAEEKVIFVREGSYEERLVVSAPNITLIGEGEDTLIHCYPYDLFNDAGYAAGGDMALRCATYIQSTAANFHAENLSFANDYVYDSEDKSNQSADALRCDADGASFVNVTVSGVQDSLYLHQGRQTFTNCRIEGLIDFIYSGDDAQVLFNDCEIVFVYVPTHAESGIICAPRTAADADCGLVFYRCSVTAEDGCAGDEFRLARPWGPDAAVYWIDCYMGNILNADVPYQDMSGNPYQAARFYECGSYGPGSAVNNDRRQISPTRAAALLSIFGLTDTEPLPGAPADTETPDTPSGGGGSSGGGGTAGSDAPDASVEGTGGTVSVSDNGTVTITPDEGYRIASITVNGETVAIPSDGKLTGLDSDDEVVVTFEKIPAGTGDAPFTDVPDNAWYADAVQYVYDNGMMTGMSSTSFSPDATTNRAMIVTILYRLEGEPEAGTSNFTDVAAGSYYADAVAWAQANDIVNGISATAFAPGNAITREQMAAILYRYAQYKGYDISVGGMALSEYTDASQISSFAATAMQWANENGLITGMTATTLAPKGSATRAQVATILMRFCEDIAL